MVAMTRTEYAQLTTADLQGRLKRAAERVRRADTDRDALTDMFAVQEIESVLQSRGIPTAADDDYEPTDSRDIAHDQSWSD